jgi:predicted nucleic acid-binding protein
LYTFLHVGGIVDVAVDASVIVAVVANEPRKTDLIELTRGVDLIAPHSVHWEIGNAFSAMLKRGRIRVDQALEAIEVYRQIPIRFVDVELDQTLEIADELGIYAYDAYLIRSALKYTVPLISLDQGLVEAARRMGVSVVEVER